MTATDGYWSKYAPTACLATARARWAALRSPSARCMGRVRRRDGEPDPSAMSPTGEVSLRTGTTVPFSGLDPQTEAGTGLAITARLYGYLLHVDPRDDSIIYDQADSVEQPDASTYIFKLRDDISFHDVDPTHGRTLVADDVVQSIERFRDNALAPTRTFHTNILDRVEAVDALSVRVTTKRPVRVHAVLSRRYFGRRDPAGGVRAARAPVCTPTAAGTGPFQLEYARLQPNARASIRHEHTIARRFRTWTRWNGRSLTDNSAKYEALVAKVDVDPLSAGSRRRVQALGGRAQRHRSHSRAQPLMDGTGLAHGSCPRSAIRAYAGAIDLALDRDAMIRDIAFSDGSILGPVNPELSGGFWSLFDDETARGLFGGTTSIDKRREAAATALSRRGLRGGQRSSCRCRTTPADARSCRRRS